MASREEWLAARLELLRVSSFSALSNRESDHQAFADHSTNKG